jgi:hypothetical protein
MARKKVRKPVGINLLENCRYSVNEKAQIEQGIFSFYEAFVKYKIASRELSILVRGLVQRIPARTNR